MSVTVTVRNAMDTNLLSVSATTPAKDALKKMVESDAWSILVKSNGEFVGVMTERDYIRRCVLKGLDPAKTPIGKVMSSPLLTIEADRPLGEALREMMRHKVRRLYVTDKGKIVGRLTQTELMEKTFDVFVALQSL
jgi:CBS domain-containing protein